MFLIVKSKNFSHVPIGFFTYEKLIELYPTTQKWQDLLEPKWHRVRYLSIDNMIFSDKEIEDYRNGERYMIKTLRNSWHGRMESLIYVHPIITNFKLSKIGEI